VWRGSGRALQPPHPLGGARWVENNVVTSALPLNGLEMNSCAVDGLVVASGCRATSKPARRSVQRLGSRRPSNAAQSCTTPVTETARPKELRRRAAGDAEIFVRKHGK
jgi:hypothetical protein